MDWNSFLAGGILGAVLQTIVHYIVEYSRGNRDNDWLRGKRT